MRASPSKMHTFLHHPTERTLLATAIVLTIVVYLVAMLTSFPWLVFAVSTHDTRFETVQDGLPVWYESKFGKITRVSGPKGFEKAPVEVLEAVRADESTEDRVVLAYVAGIEGVVLGILHKNNSFEHVLADGTNKADLAVRPDGIALFTRTSGGESTLVQVDLQKGTDSLLERGRGHSGRLFTDGFFLALSPQGLIRIDPASTSTDAILVSRANADNMNSSLSSDGVRATIPNTSGKTDFFSVRSLSPANLSVEMTLPELYRTPVIWISPEYFTVLNNSDMFVLYRFNGGVLYRVAEITLT